MGAPPNTRRFDRLTPEQRKHAEIHSERKAFNDQTAMSEAMLRAGQPQPTDTPPNKAATWRNGRR